MEAVFEYVQNGECINQSYLHSKHRPTRPSCLPGGDVGGVFPQGRGGAQLYLLAEVEEGVPQHARHVLLVQLHRVVLAF